MITTKLPTIKKHIDDTTNKLVVEKGEITVGIDTSLFAEERWERFFPHNAKNETLFAYVERIQNAGVVGGANIVSDLKALYCFMESDEIPDFKSFLQMFDLADTEYLKALSNKIKFVFEIALKTATANAKN